jgi:hypothetical protein
MRFPREHDFRKCSCFGLRFPVVGAGVELRRDIMLLFGGGELVKQGIFGGASDAVF